MDKTSKSMEAKVRYFEVMSSVNTLKEITNFEQTWGVGSSSATYFAKAVSSSESAVHLEAFCLNKCRTINLPKIGNYARHDERLLVLDQDEGLLEKCYFVFNPLSKNLALQVNAQACAVASFPKVVSLLLKNNTKEEIMYPVLDVHEMQLDDQIVSAELACKFGNEIPPEHFDGSDLEEGMQKLIGYAGPSVHTVAMKIAWDKREPKSGMVKTIGNFIDRLHPNKAKVRVLRKEDAEEDRRLVLLDLIAPLRESTIDMAMESSGKYPLESSVIRQLSNLDYMK